MGRPSYYGATVRLLAEHRTNGGMRFRKGTIMLVTSVERDGLDLCCYKRGHRMSIRCVKSYDVEVISRAKKEED